jgi:hypothetical protein
MWNWHDVVALSCVVAATLLFLVVKTSLCDLQHPLTAKKADRLAVNAATCFLWPALVFLLLRVTEQDLGFVSTLTFLVVLLYLCHEVKALVPFVGPLKEYTGGDSLLERSTQISTAGFAAGTILLSSNDLSRRVAPFVLLALLMAVVSTVPSSSYRKCNMEKRATWESAQKAAMAMGAGLLAMAMGICVDAKLFTPAQIQP